MISSVVEGGYGGCYRNGRRIISLISMCRYMPCHLKKVTNCYKTMRACDVCTIFNDMHGCLVTWRKKKIKSMQERIRCVCPTTNNCYLVVALQEYINQTMIEGDPMHRTGFEAASMVMYPPIHVGDRKLNLYSCTFGSCKNCLTWESQIPAYEKTCLENISYCVFSRYHY